MRLKHLLFTFALTTIFLIAGKVGWGQESIFNETFGTPSATTAVNSYTGWSSSATFSSNTADVRTSSASAGYTGASASGNVMMNAVGEYLLISGISTAGYTNISLSLGLRKGTSAENGSTLAIEVSDNGTDWVPLTYTLPTGTGTATWHYITPTGTIPATATLSIRFTPSSTVEFRLDDISLQGELPDAVAPVPTFDPVDAATGVAITVNPTITFDETIYTAAGVLVDNSNVESLITFTDGTDPVAFTATITDKVITIVPSADLANAIEHTVTIAAVEDAAGNLMAAPASASFTTIAAGAKAINITGPEANEVFTVQTVNVEFTVDNFVLNTDGKVKYTLTPSGTGSTASGVVTASPISLTELTEDSYTIGLELVDMAEASLVPTVTASIQFSVNLEDVATPTFTPVAGTYYSTQNVEITCATADAEIRYTTNGDEPTEASSLYSTPIEVSATTTIKAKAFKAGMTPSALATAAYTIVTPTDVADIAALRASAADNTTVYKLTSAATITQTDGFNNRKYIQDASGAILIYDPNPAKITGTYNVGDGITNVIGKLVVSNGMLRFTPVADAETTTSNPAIAPEVKALDAITVDDEAKLVKVVNVMFNPATGTFATGKNYTLEDGAANTLVLRTDFFSADYIGTDIPTTSVTLTGVLVDYNGTMQITPRNLDDFQSIVSTLSDLKVSETTLDGFASSKLVYDVVLPVGTSVVPTVSATATDSKATVNVTAATSLPGKTTVEVTAEDGISKSVYEINFTVATGIDDVKWGVNLEVYPNPFTNTINFSNVEDVELITVTNLIGQRVMTVKPESSNSINTDNLIKGIYLVSFQNRDGKVIVRKMIKQ